MHANGVISNETFVHNVYNHVFVKLDKSLALYLSTLYIRTVKVLGEHACVYRLSDYIVWPTIVVSLHTYISM